MKAGGKAKLEMRVFCSRSMPSGSGAVPSSVEKKKGKKHLSWSTQTPAHLALSMSPRSGRTTKRLEARTSMEMRVSVQGTLTFPGLL